MSIGIIGSGSIGAGLARLAVAAGVEVVIANSRGPESLSELVRELGAGVRAGDAREAAKFGDLTVLAIPLHAYAGLPDEDLTGRTILSTGNYYPGRDGRITTLDAQELTTAEYEQSLLSGARIVKAFNNIYAPHIPLLANSQPRTALPVAGDDPAAKAAVSSIVECFGFDAVDAGSLVDSWRFEPESGAYTPIYADLDEDGKGFSAERAAPVTADRLRELLAASRRPDTASRQY